MIFDSIKRNGTVILLYSTAIIVLLWSSSLFWDSRELVEPGSQRSLSNLIYRIFNTQFISLLAAAIAILSAALLLYRLNERHLFITKREQLLPITFILLSSAFTEFRYISGAHFALLAILLSLDYLFTAYRNDYAYKQIFLAALFASVAALFYPLTLYFGLIIFIGIIILKPTQWRDYVVFIAGLITPYIFALFYYFFILETWTYPFQLLQSHLHINLPIPAPTFTPTEWLFFIYTFLFFISSLFKILFNPNRGHKIKTKGINYVFFWMYFICLACIILYSQTYANGYIMYIMIPTTISFVSYFADIKSGSAGSLFFGLLVACVISVQLPVEFYIAIANTAVEFWLFIMSLF